ncbi:MAG: hypothetical protein MUP45_02630 [Candidatus Marinimicrobia bacterium]|nr:hypothetical protein [Candidatus Neomarinimicrobiota bacterium]
MVKIIIIAGLAALIITYLKRKIVSILTFQWLTKIVLAVALILILGIIIGLF